ncbi:GspE/PulE family protein [Azonexus hydrophilus]|uniref:ATPase, T2SS/T4P/T4SS family n=1 Tax=Azonexus hydrophilus TaxID=418702 RepID=A0ABZ2XLI1_9RHOO
MGLWDSVRSRGGHQGLVATAPGTSYEEIVETLSEEAKRYVSFERDGTLKVSKTHRFHPLVTGFIARLERLAVQYQTQHVELIEISKSKRDVDAVLASREQSDTQRIAKTLFDRAVSLRTSDIHIRCSKMGNTQILFRVDGDLETVEEHDWMYGEHLCTTIYQSMTDVSDPTFEPLSRQDARISKRSNLPMELDGIRVATSPQVDGYIMVLRLLYNDKTTDFRLTLLGYEEDQCHQMGGMKAMPTGINVISGPTGSGKSTTLQRTLGGIIAETEGKKHIITVEDPPEYPIPGSVQTPVANAETAEERSRAFQAAIKAAMRLDPDIIMIGETRDEPSASLAVQAAMTGHQVWTTLHANNSFGIIDRLLDLGVPMEVLSDPSIVTGLICQRLIKTLCPLCKVPLSEAYKVAPTRYSTTHFARLKNVVDLNKVFVTGDGCPHCRHSGTKGRTVVAEVVKTNQIFMDMIKAGDRKGAKAYWKKSMGGMSMVEHTIIKVQLGIVDPFKAEETVGPLDSEFESARLFSEAHGGVIHAA